jgi:hypothetical protein
VFALVETSEQAEQVQQQLRAKLPDPDLGIWAAQCISTGIQLVR